MSQFLPTMSLIRFRRIYRYQVFDYCSGVSKASLDTRLMVVRLMALAPGCLSWSSELFRYSGLEACDGYV
jgi:hypothetical protein